MSELPADNYRRRFIPGRDVDGDTILTDVVDVGYHIAAYRKIRYRFAGINTPESNRKATAAEGKAAARYTTAWTRDHLHDSGTYLVAETVKEPGEDGALTLTDSFGRYIAKILCPVCGRVLNDDLVTDGHAVYKTY